MNDLEWPLLLCYIIYNEKFIKVMQRTETEALIPAARSKHGHKVCIIINTTMNIILPINHIQMELSTKSIGWQ